MNKSQRDIVLGDGYIMSKNQGSHGTGKTGMAKKNPCQGKHREFGNFVKTQGKRNFVSSSCKCSDCKSKGYCDS